MDAVAQVEDLVARRQDRRCRARLQVRERFCGCRCERARADGRRASPRQRSTDRVASAITTIVSTNSAMGSWKAPWSRRATNTRDDHRHPRASPHRPHPLAAIRDPVDAARTPPARTAALPSVRTRARSAPPQAARRPVRGRGSRVVTTIPTSSHATAAAANAARFPSRSRQFIVPSGRGVQGHAPATGRAPRLIASELIRLVCRGDVEAAHQPAPASAGSRSSKIGHSRSAPTRPSRTLSGSGDAPAGVCRYAARQPASLAPTTSAAQSSPTWRIDRGRRPERLRRRSEDLRVRLDRPDALRHDDAVSHGPSRPPRRIGRS